MGKVQCQATWVKRVYGISIHPKNEGFIWADFNWLIMKLPIYACFIPT